MKNPFKKTAIIDTLVNVGVGGAANVAMDYVFDSVEALASVAEYKNVIKIGVGVLGGTMITNKYARSAFDGIATVGVSELVSSYMTDGANNGGDTTKNSGAGRLPYGTIGRIAGRVRPGQRGFGRKRVAGVGNALSVISK